MSKTIKTPRTAKPSNGVRFMVSPQARPSSGEALASYTAAWLTLSGMGEGGVVPTKTVRALAGDTAYGYHKRLGNFEVTKDGVTLSSVGLVHFMNAGNNRTITPNAEMVEAYMQTMTKGTPSTMVKNTMFIKPAQ